MPAAELLKHHNQSYWVPACTLFVPAAEAHVIHAICKQDAIFMILFISVAAKEWHHLGHW